MANGSGLYTFFIIFPRKIILFLISNVNHIIKNFPLYDEKYVYNHTISLNYFEYIYHISIGIRYIGRWVTHL